MKRIYKNQSKLRIIIHTKCNLTDSSEIKINYIKPDKSEGFFEGHIMNAEEGTIFYDVATESEIDQCGFWKLFPEIKFDDDRAAVGRAEKVFVYGHGE